MLFYRKSYKVMDRIEISNLILKRLNDLNINSLAERYEQSGKINYIAIENLLPYELASRLSDLFPIEEELKHFNMVQENKFVGVNFSESQKIIEECLYSFQEKKVIEAISKITRIEDLVGDPKLYAGGISSMSKGCFLNPHIDNSHDMQMERYRRLNLLFYVNKNWTPDKDGGELVLYPKGIKGNEISISCAFNKLVIMKTDNRSLHGVKKITSTLNRRKCISNYYFSNESPTKKSYYHSTSFQGFKRQYLKGIFLKLNAFARTNTKLLFYKLTKKSISTNNHRDS